jgi:hypothetical protein
MGLEYTFEFYTLEVFKELAEDEPRHLFVCRPDGKCGVEEQYPEFGKLAELFECKGKEGFELVQIFFQERGVLALYKRPKQ